MFYEMFPFLDYCFGQTSFYRFLLSMKNNNCSQNMTTIHPHQTNNKLHVSK